MVTISKTIVNADINAECGMKYRIEDSVVDEPAHDLIKGG
jgi:hypothetical protein